MIARVVEQIRENMYLQYFVGLSSFQSSAPFDASLMVSIRKRLGKDVMDQFNQEVLKQAGILPIADQEAAKPGGDDSDEHEDGNETMVQDKLAAPRQDKPQQPDDSTPLLGTLLLDATVAEQQIEYPTDLKLLNESREQLERIIAKACKDLNVAQPRTYKHRARR